jgi:hypothetical protein
MLVELNYKKRGGGEKGGGEGKGKNEERKRRGGKGEGKGGCSMIVIMNVSMLIYYNFKLNPLSWALDTWIWQCYCLICTLAIDPALSARAH